MEMKEKFDFLFFFLVSMSAFSMIDVRIMGLDDDWKE